jgi:hypothetical protein
MEATLLWHWQGDNPVSADALAEKIMDVLDEHQKRASPVLAHHFPDALELLREMGTPSGRTENLSPHECQDGCQGE